MSILAEILEAKRDEVEAARAQRPASEVCTEAERAPAPRGLRRALSRPSGEPVRALAEIKRASPSAGAIRPNADPAAIARAYEEAGAAAISVLTDERYFDGSLSFLGAAREAVSVPILRKDFLIDRYQIAEARAAGADGVLLIAAALGPGALSELMRASRAWGMDALVEVHDGEEAERAVAAGARLIGINHRDLRTFSIDKGLTARIAPTLPGGVAIVAESGIAARRDVAALAGAGADAILVGERLMRADSPGRALAELLAEGEGA